MPFWKLRDRAPQPVRRMFRLLSAVTVIMTLLACAVGAIALRFIEQRLVADAGESVALAAVDIAGKLDLLLAERYGDMQMLAVSPVLHAGNPAAMTPYLESVQTAYPVYLWLAVTDPNGRILAATDPDSVGLDVSRASWFASVRKTGGIVMEDAAVTAGFDRTMAVTLAAPSISAASECSPEPQPMSRNALPASPSGNSLLIAAIAESIRVLSTVLA